MCLFSIHLSAQSTIDSIKVAESHLESVEINHPGSSLKNRQDSTWLTNQKRDSKKKLGKDAKESLNGLVLTDLDGKDLAKRAMGVVKNQKPDSMVEENNDFVTIDKEYASLYYQMKMKQLGDDKYMKIFNANSRRMDNEERVVKEDLVAMATIQEEKKALYDSIQDPVLANHYYQYLNGDYDLEELANKVKGINQKTDEEESRKERKKFLKKLRKRDKEERKLSSRIAGNEYLRQLADNTHLDSLKEANPTNYYQNVDRLIKKHSYQNKIDSLLPEMPTQELAGITQSQLREEVLDKNKVETLFADEQHEVKNTGWKNYLKKEEVVKHKLSDKKGFWSNTSLEGVIASSGIDFKTFSISPNLSKNVGKNASVGIGGTFHYSVETNINIRAALDFKLIGQYDLFRETAFFRVEYVEMIPGISYLEVANESDEMRFQHTVLLGAGWNINIKGKQFLSFGLMYNVNTAMGVPTYDTPMLSRLGIRIF